MRIQDRTSLGPSAAQTERAPEAQKAGHDSAGKTAGSGSGEGDRVELSFTLGRLSQAIGTYANDRAQRVQALAGDYQAGRLRPNSQATSHAMIAEALAVHG